MWRATYLMHRASSVAAGEAEAAAAAREAALAEAEATLRAREADAADAAAAAAAEAEERRAAAAAEAAQARAELEARAARLAAAERAAEERAAASLRDLGAQVRSPCLVPCACPKLAGLELPSGAQPPACMVWAPKRSAASSCWVRGGRRIRQPACTTRALTCRYMTHGRVV